MNKSRFACPLKFWNLWVEKWKMWRACLYSCQQSVIAIPACSTWKTYGVTIPSLRSVPLLKSATRPETKTPLEYYSVSSLTGPCLLGSSPRFFSLYRQWKFMGSSLLSGQLSNGLSLLTSSLERTSISSTMDMLLNYERIEDHGKNENRKEKIS